MRRGVMRISTPPAGWVDMCNSAGEAAPEGPGMRTLMTTSETPSALGRRRVPAGEITPDRSAQQPLGPDVEAEPRCAAAALPGVRCA